MAGKATQATRALDKAGVSYRLHSYIHDPAADSYGGEAAEVLGVDARRVFKTLVAEVDGALHIGVVPVTGQLGLKALAAAVGGKRARMAEVAAAERATGHVAGGISPLGHRQRIAVVLDESALEFPTLFCSAGRRGLELEIAPKDLIAVAAARTAPIAA